jgi:glutathione synthase
MTNIAFLVAATDTIIEGNYLKFANEMLSRGAKTHIAVVDSLALSNSKIVIQGVQIATPLLANEPFPKELTTFSVENFDIVWIMALGYRHSFLDKIQMLYGLPDSCRIINSLDALMHFKSKYFLASHPSVFSHPETHAAANPRTLLEIIQTGGKWIAKPPAGSFGRDVYFLTAEDPNAGVILDSLTGQDQDQYCLIQRYVEEIEQGEKRVLFAGGEVVGQYLRTPTTDHRTNIMQGAAASLCELTDQEAEYCLGIGKLMKSYGAEFVGMDLAYPWVIEFNVITPGGVETIQQLGGPDLTKSILDKIL